jgi:alkylation response protein AidB-like acyl-CoA dehydrogenase
VDLEGVTRRLFDDAVEVDAGTAAGAAALAQHWSVLADAQLLGVQAREGVGAASRVLAALAGSCLSTAFLWLQHEGATAAVSSSPLADDLLPGLCDGSVRAGLALGGLRPGPDQLRASPTDGGWSLTGHVPWVSGFGMVDHLQVAAAYGDEVVFLLVPATASGIDGTVLPLVAAAASATATVRFEHVFVAANRELRRVPAQAWSETQQHGVALNGFLAVGVAQRCALLAGSADLDPALIALRDRLLSAAPEQVPEARAEAALLAVHAATTLVLATGSGATVRGGHVERLWREASFLLVFASRPLIKAATLGRLGAAGW